MPTRTAEACAAVECEGADRLSLLVKGSVQSDLEGLGPLTGGDSGVGLTDPGSAALRPHLPNPTAVGPGSQVLRD